MTEVKITRETDTINIGYTTYVIKSKTNYDRGLYVYDGIISCGVKLIDGIENFFTYWGKENVELEVKQCFITLLKSIIENHKTIAFFVISYRENDPTMKQPKYRDFINLLFEPFNRTELNHNSDNVINIKIGTRTNLKEMINKLEKELFQSSSSIKLPTEQKVLVGDAF